MRRSVWVRAVAAAAATRSAGLCPERGEVGRPLGSPAVRGRALAVPAAHARDRLGLVLVLGDDVLERLVDRRGGRTRRTHGSVGHDGCDLPGLAFGRRRPVGVGHRPGEERNATIAWTRILL